MISIGVSTIKIISRPEGLFTLLVRLGPYLTTLSVFTTFILYNGGVVLGDKSNHTATLHFPQMLYIWPYIAFFSWPLLAPYLLILPLLALAGNSPLEPMLIFRRRGFIPRRLPLLAIALLAIIIIRYNTIIHPFTLADNRHYTFYIFRLLLRTHSSIRYGATPIYMLTAWASIQTLGARNRTSAPGPTTNPSSASSRSSENENDSESTMTLQPARSNAASVLPTSSTPTTTAFFLLWLLTTALQLVTAPLFEPRYLLLPWIFWRLHLPTQQPFSSTTEPTEASFSSSNEDDVQRQNASSGKARATKADRDAVSSWWERQNPLLWAETAWFLLVNGVTGYVFLRRGFEWEQEPGRVQRFMW